MHAALVYGYKDKKAVALCRDSIFVEMLVFSVLVLFLMHPSLWRTGLHRHGETSYQS